MNTPRTLEEVLAQLDGIPIESCRREAELRSRLSSIGKLYRCKAPSDWPNLTFNWDLSAASQRFALDGCKSDEFLGSYPSGLVAGYVEITHFDAVLCHFNRRDGLEELWECGSESKLAYLIAYLAEGRPITPPLVAVTPRNELCFVGGNHRYTVAKFSGERIIPIYAEPSSTQAIDRLVSVRWIDA